MSFESLLVQQAQILRRAPGEDRFNLPLEKTYTVVATVPCRAGASWSGGEQNTERMREVYQQTNTVFLPAGTDVHESDRIRVLDKNGVELSPPGEILSKEAVVGRWGDVHHIECRVQIQRGPR